ncbi:hypothetical protein ACOSP7_016730 [Xanthoceras sorbifolium]|uniref:Uncharacterized protein n=1 Tax=Xanthoceras sorbifolium TaxID=99658 RepID=A0ABQ8HIH4_9ROSI|nr:hypothetical protein JRO89_XS10G0124000 [Xanthoceras sorbifolium]
MNSKESQIQTSVNGQDDPGEYAMQLVTASAVPMVLKAAIELGVLDVIDKAGSGALLSPSQIAVQIAPGNKPEAPLVLERILRLLAGHSILTCSVDTKDDDSDDQVHLLYGLAPVAKYFVRNQEGGGSLRDMMNMIQDKVMLNVWYHLKDAVLDGGIPFNKAYGMTALEYTGKDPEFAELFMSAMRDFNPLFARKMLEIYTGFEGLKSLVDVGGGDGSILNMIVSKYPNIKGINYDLAAVIEKSPSYPGIENVAGDMFTHIPNGDAIFMKWVLHYHDDESCLKVLKKCYEAIPVNGKVIVVDMVLPDTPEASLTGKSLFELESILMNVNPGGKEKTRREFESMAKEAGFSHIQVPCSAYNYSIVEFYKSF